MTNKHSRFDSMRTVSLMLALLISASAISCGSPMFMRDSASELT